MNDLSVEENRRLDGALASPMKPYELPYELKQALRLTARQRAVLGVVDAGLTLDQVEALRDLFETEAEEKAPAAEAKVAPPTIDTDTGPSKGMIAAGCAALGFLGGAWLVAALIPKPKPTLKARLANWLLDEL